MKCDVIIPVYNAFNCLKPCIDSVLKHTDFSSARLLLIDDKSPDERVLPLLKEYAAKYPDKITLLENPENLGFVKTVNRGMQFSKHDVLLLNSDTEVTKNWLAKIQACAYSDPSIATVTPLSNCATLASVPQLFARNDLPKGYSLSQMAKLVEDCSNKLYPSIPTAHGFCMFIKRETIKKIGYFDEVAFGKGYGEENDFSFRCINFGYRNALCDDTYILHKESQSFLSDKKDNGAALAKKHPKLKANLDFWIQHPDIKHISENVALALGTANSSRKNVLVIIHDWSQLDSNVGGTTLHVLDLIKHLRSEYNFHVLFPENGVYKVRSHFEDFDLTTGIYKKTLDISLLECFSNDYAEMLSDIIETYGISLVHVHHLLHHYFNLSEVCKAHGVKYIVSLHDLYLNYPEVSKLDERVSSGSNLIDLSSWRTICEHFLSQSSAVVAPSEFAKRAYKKSYKDISIDVIEHGVDVEKISSTSNPSNSKKNIAFVGAIFPHKGSGILEALATKKLVKNCTIHLFGTTTASLKKSASFKSHGRYERKNLPELLKKHQIDLVCAFSLAPETFAYTIEEVAAAGVPILSFDIGAGAERVRKYHLGWVIDYTNDPQKIASAISKVLSDKTAYAKVLRSIEQYSPRTVSEMVEDYRALYQKFASSGRLKPDVLRARLPEVIFKDSLLVGDNDYYRNEYGKIIGSFRWRLVSKLRVPRAITEPLRKIYHQIKK